MPRQNSASSLATEMTVDCSGLEPTTKLDEGNKSSSSVRESKEFETAGVFRQGSSVCICEIFPTKYMGVVQVDLSLLAKLLPVHSNEHTSTIVGIMYGSIERGNAQAKKLSQLKKEESRMPQVDGNRFQNQVQLKVRLPGAENASVKFFKTGRLQTAGCRTRELSIRAVQDVAKALACVATMEGGHAVLINCTPEESVQLCKAAYDNVRVSKECILGSFSTGFSGPRGTSINMHRLAAMLSSQEFQKQVKSIKFNSEPSAHEANFKQLGIYLNKDAFEDADQNIYVNIFSSGKCTVTSATSTDLAQRVVHMVTKMLCDNYDRIVEDKTTCADQVSRDSCSSPARSDRKRKHLHAPKRMSAAFRSISLSKQPKTSLKPKEEKRHRSHSHGGRAASMEEGSLPQNHRRADWDSLEETRSNVSSTSSTRSICSSFSTQSSHCGGSDVDVADRSTKMNAKDSLMPLMQVIWCPSAMVRDMRSAGWCPVTHDSLKAMDDEIVKKKTGGRQQLFVGGPAQPGENERSNKKSQLADDEFMLHRPPQDHSHHSRELELLLGQSAFNTPTLQTHTIPLQQQNKMMPSAQGLYGGNSCDRGACKDVGLFDIGKFKFNSHQLEPEQPRPQLFTDRSSEGMNFSALLGQYMAEGSNGRQNFLNQMADMCMELNKSKASYAASTGGVNARAASLFSPPMLEQRQADIDPLSNLHSQVVANLMSLGDKNVTHGRSLMSLGDGNVTHGKSLMSLGDGNVTHGSNTSLNFSSPQHPCPFTANQSMLMSQCAEALKLGQNTCPKRQRMSYY